MDIRLDSADDGKEQVRNEEELPIINNHKNDLILPWKDAIKQILASCLAYMIAIQPGINMSFSAILLPQLNQTDSEIIINKSEASWIASIVAIALPLGSCCVGPLIDKFGRKRTCIMTMIPFLLAWILHIFSNNIWYIYAGRFIAGAAGGLTTAVLIYVSEITHPKYRSMLLSLNSVAVTLGILLTCILGFWFNWRSISKIFFLFTLISSIGLFWLPESPYWLIVFKDDRLGCIKSLKWLYKDNALIESTLTTILESKRQQQQNELNEESTRLHRFKTDLIEYYRDSTIWKPLLILFSLFLFQQLSGSYVIIFYAVDIFREIGNQLEATKDNFFTLILLGLIRFILAIISAVASKRIGRRTIMFISISGMILTSLACGLLINFNNNNLTSNVTNNASVLHAEQIEINNNTGNNNQFTNIALILVLLYVAFSSLGYLVIPWTLIGELLPVRVRGKLGGVMVAMAYLLMFIAVKIFPFLLEFLGIGDLFLCAAIINVVAVIFVYVWLPETLGKSFLEIERIFNK